jgi:hypothetical protein
MATSLLSMKAWNVDGFNSSAPVTTEASDPHATALAAKPTNTQATCLVDSLIMPIDQSRNPESLMYVICLG